MAGLPADSASVTQPTWDQVDLKENGRSDRVNLNLDRYDRT